MEPFFLRPLSMADLDQVYRLTSLPEVARFMRFQTHTSRREAQSLLEEYLAAGNFSYGVWMEKQGMIGVAVMKREEEEAGCLSLSAFSHPRFWGKGIFTWATARMVEMGRIRPEIHTLKAYVVSKNTGSRRVLEKNGFVLAQERFFPDLEGSLLVYRKDVSAAPKQELLEVRDVHGERTGRNVIRDDPHENLAPDEYLLGVHVYLRNRQGKYLIQKRSMFKRHQPGQWDITGGAVEAGEGSRDAAVREVQEELGLSLEGVPLHFLARLVRPCHSLVDVWLAELDFSLEDCTLQEKEVAEAALVSREAMLRVIFEGEGGDCEYRRLLEKRLPPAGKKEG